jgi:hypothetical protein
MLFNNYMIGYEALNWFLESVWRYGFAKNKLMAGFKGGTTYYRIREKYRLEQQKIMDIDEAQRRRHMSNTLQWVVMESTTSLGATSAHDIIYGFLGLVDPNLWMTTLKPDYTAPLPRLFHEWTVFLMESSNSLELMGRPGKHLPDVPSWVPDYRFQRYPDPSKLGEEHRAEGSFHFSDDKRKLIADGVFLRTCYSIDSVLELPYLASATGKELEDEAFDLKAGAPLMTLRLAIFLEAKLKALMKIYDDSQKLI